MTESLSELRGAVNRYVDLYHQPEGAASGHAQMAWTPPVAVLRNPAPTPLTSCVYEPFACLIVGGVKRIVLGEQSFVWAAGDVAFAGHDLSLRSGITDASDTEPYLAMLLKLDLDLIQSFGPHLDRRELAGGDSAGDRPSLGSAPADDDIVDAFGRLLRSVEHPSEREVLAPLIVQELHYRIACLPQASVLQHLSEPSSAASLVADAIAELRRRFDQRVRVADLAELVGMSPSTFHDRFKAITGTTPLQYQKDLRLIEARRLLAEEEASASEASYRVGYRSPAQFSREYARKFGAPPSRHDPKVPAVV